MSTETTTQMDTQGVASLLLVAGLIEGTHFCFLENKEKVTIKMLGDEKNKRASLLTLRTCLKEQKIKYYSVKEYVYLLESKNETKNVSVTKNEMLVRSNVTDALLYLLNQHKILFFVKEETGVEMKIQCIDADEIKKVVEICVFYNIKFESSVPRFEVTLFKSFDFEQVTADKVTTLENTNPKKFSKELIDSIYAVDYELDKQKILVQKPVERLVKDVTRSRRYIMSHNRKNIEWIKNFSLYMMNVYGVDVLQDSVDQHTFFVIGPKDVEFSSSSTESINRTIRKTKDSIHPVSKLLIENGIKCYTSKDKQTPSFTLRLDDQKFPKTISFHCMDLKEKEKAIKKTLSLLKNEGYQVSLSQTKQRIVFLSVNEAVKGSHPISELLKNGKFVTRKNGRNSVPAFSIRFFPGTKNVSHIAFVGGNENERQKVAEQAKVFLAEHGFYFNRKDGVSTLTLSSEKSRTRVLVSSKIEKPSKRSVQNKQLPDSFLESLSEEQINLFLEGIPKTYLKQKFRNALAGFVVIREKDAIAMRPDLFVSIEELLKK